MKVPNQLNHIRVLQKNGKPLVGEDFTPLADFVSPDKQRSTATADKTVYKTRTEMNEHRRMRDKQLLTTQAETHESECLKRLQDQKNSFAGKSMIPQTEKKQAISQKVLKSLDQRLKDSDRQYHRSKQGMYEEPRPVTTLKELDQEERQNVKTTQELL